MLQEQWSRWTPQGDIQDNYYLISLKDTVKNLTINLAYFNDDDYEAQFLFSKSSIAGYRQIEEGSQLTLYNELSEKYSDSFYGKWPFFIVENSRFLEFILKNSTDPNLYVQYIHFSFFTTDHIIDVIAKNYPEVTCSFNPTEQ